MSAEKTSAPSARQPYCISAVNISGSGQIIELLNPEYHKEGVCITSFISGISYNEIIRSLAACPITVEKTHVHVKRITQLSIDEALKPPTFDLISRMDVVEKDVNGSRIVVPLELQQSTEASILESKSRREFRIDTLTYINVFLPSYAMVEIFLYPKAPSQQGGI